MPRLLRRACRFASGGEGFEGDVAGDAGLKGGAVLQRQTWDVVPLWRRAFVLLP
jgi:hypothetical protein